MTQATKPRTATRISLAGAVVLAALAAGLVACGGGSSDTTADSSTALAEPGSPEPGTFQLGLTQWIGYAPFFIAEDKGYYGDLGLDANIRFFGTEDQRNTALGGGKLDGANSMGTQALVLEDAGIPVKIVQVQDVSLTADAILAGPGIDSVSDLKGKKVAYEPGGGSSELMFLDALKLNGMSPDDVEGVPIPASDSAAALIAGKVDAAVTYEPYISEAVASGTASGIKKIFTAGDDRGLVADVLVVPEDVASEKPNQIVALLRAWDDGLNFYKQNTEAGQKMTANAFGVSPEDLRSSFDGVEFYDTKQSADLLNGEYLDILNKLNELAVEAGMIPHELDQETLESMIDPTFSEAAANRN